jgi:hypothetical protein
MRTSYRDIFLLTRAVVMVAATWLAVVRRRDTTSVAAKGDLAGTIP